MSMKLNRYIVLEVRQRFQLGYTQYELSEIYQLDLELIERICKKVKYETIQRD
jgi:hypothetical protein